MRFLRIILFWLIRIGLTLGVLGFLLVGLMDVTGTSRIGSVGTTVGIIGLILGAINLIGLFTVSKGPLPLLITAVALVALSLTVMHFSPARLGAFFGPGDPAKFLALWGTVTGGLMAVLALLEYVSRAKSGKLN